MSGFVNIATKAAYNAANVIQQGSLNLSNFKITKKGHNDFVTELDKKSEQIIIETIKKAYPTHSILAEEGGFIAGANGGNKENAEAEFTWIIDPIDGTTNFIHGNP